MGKPRERCESNIYHVTVRGVGRQTLFEDDEDCEAFLSMLGRYLADTGGELLAWCLMGNHAHLLFRIDMDELSLLMRRTENAYAARYNSLHGHAGHVFQGRFGSVPVKDDAQLLAVVRYIHRNPVEAGISPDPSYRWSSYPEYMGRPRLCATGLVLDMLGGAEGFARLHGEGGGCAGARPAPPPRRMGDNEARSVLGEVVGGGAETLRALPKDERDGCIRRLKALGITVRQLERLTGIGRGIIQRA